MVQAALGQLIENREVKMINKEFEKLNDEELEQKIVKLQRILYSTNMNLSMQARDILEQYKYEQELRLDKKLTEHFKKRNKNIENNEDSPINIG